MDDQGDQRALTAALDRFSRKADELLKTGNTTTQTVRVEGMGSMWNGIAIGIALGGTIFGAGWVGSSIIRQDNVVQQGEAYKRAVYMLAPRFAEEIDKELDRQKERENELTDPDHHAAPGSDAQPEPAPAKSAAAAAP